MDHITSTGSCADEQQALSSCAGMKQFFGACRTAQHAPQCYDDSSCPSVLTCKPTALQTVPAAWLIPRSSCCSCCPDSSRCCLHALQRVLKRSLQLLPAPLGSIHCLDVVLLLDVCMCAGWGRGLQSGWQTRTDPLHSNSTKPLPSEQLQVAAAIQLCPAGRGCGLVDTGQY